MPAADLLDQAREAAAWVARRARHVHIDTDRLAVYDAGIDADDAKPEPGPEADMGLVVQLDAVNFGSGWHPVLHKPAGWSGSRTIATALRTHGPFDADELIALTPAACAEVFGQEAAGEPGELMALFARSLSDLGRFVATRFDGSFTDMVASADRSAVRLVELLLDMPMYRDMPTYDGRPVPLLKRAQITVNDLGADRFADIDRLTMFADNLVPHVLRLDGVLTVDPDLVARIERGGLLAYGSPEEVELRAVSLHAVELLARRIPRPPRLIDAALWRRGGEPRYKAVPRPRCRTTAY